MRQARTRDLHRHARERATGSNRRCRASEEAAAEEEAKAEVRRKDRMTPASKSTRFSVDDLVLPVSESYDPKVFDIAAYDDFVEGIVLGRTYSKDAIRKALIFLGSGRYSSAADLAEEAFANSSRLQDAYGTEEALVQRLPFPDKLSCSIDLATGTGKTYVMFAIARILMNEGIVNRVLVLCPSTTIERGLIEKLDEMLADSDLTSLLPERSGVRTPDRVDATQTIGEGQMCVENIHQAYEKAGSSIRDSFTGQGESALVLSDEVHHVYSPTDAKLKKWSEFIADEKFGFRRHVGVSGTCYVANEYIADVIHRYSIRDAIDDGWVKDVFYVEKDDSKTDGERFQKLRTQHEKNRKTYGEVKPITIAITQTIKAAKALRDDLVSFLGQHMKGGEKEAEDRVLVVTSAKEHEESLLTLATVDAKTNPVEWIVSVSMLSEGWDVKNVFQIYPHEKRAFNSRLLIAQVLGRGMRHPPHVTQEPRVYVFNHAKWGAEVDGLVAAVIDRETSVAQRPTDERQVDHFELHRLTFKNVPTKLKAKKLEKPKEITKLSLNPQMDADEKTEFVSAGRSGARETLLTRVEQTYYPVAEVVAQVRERMRDHDERTGGTLTKAYPKTRVDKLIRDGLKGVKEKQDRISQENRKQILSAFGSLQQKRTRPGAIWAQEADGVETISTADMGASSARISGLTGDLALFYDEISEKAVSGDDAAALKKAKELDKETATRLERVSNSYLFKSPVTLVLASHMPEREFVRALLEDGNAEALKAWIKSPDVAFFEIEFGYEKNGRKKHGRFNPDFFLLLEDADTAVVVETKADDGISTINRGKAEAADRYFADLNSLLEKQGASRRYQFHFLSPEDYPKFFEALRGGTLDGFRSKLHADLVT
jgi:type III restriction enzyme